MKKMMMKTMIKKRQFLATRIGKPFTSRKKVKNTDEKDNGEEKNERRKETS